MARHPGVVAGETVKWAGDEIRVVAGSSPAKADPKDRRFDDSAWSHPLWRRLAQTYLTTRGSVLHTVDELDLDTKSADRAKFALSQLTEASAPTNSLVTNPAALKRASIRGAGPWSMAAGTSPTTSATTAACPRKSTPVLSGLARPWR